MESIYIHFIEVSNTNKVIVEPLYNNGFININKFKSGGKTIKLHKNTCNGNCHRETVSTSKELRLQAYFFNNIPTVNEAFMCVL